MSKPTEMDPRPIGAMCHKINVTWGDCDPARIVYTGRLPWFALDAINGWWEAQLGGDGWFQFDVDRNLGTPFVRLEMDFVRPVTPRHPWLCYLWPEALGETSITFCVDGEQEGQRYFSSRSVQVFVTSDAFKKRTPPIDLREIVLSALPEQAR